MEILSHKMFQVNETSELLPFLMHIAAFINDAVFLTKTNII